MLVNENNSMPYMKSLATCLNRMIAEGYAEDFKIGASGLEALQHGRVYTPQDITIVTFFRFEGESHDNAELYVIETSDGLKGTVVDSYESDSDKSLNQFMIDVENFQKKVTSR